MKIGFKTIAVILVCVLCVRCKHTNNPSEILQGNWLIAYPDHQLKSQEQRTIYGRYQDSIVNLYGLKLISMNGKGEFVEIDSLLKKPAKWIAGKDGSLVIQEGGRGFNPFKVSYDDYTDTTLRLVQYLLLNKERIKIVWHLKKITDDNEAAFLFFNEVNEWRKKPATAEAEPVIRQRLINMLNYYSNYFKLISKEASYFLIPRVPLPLQYYQHATATSILPACNWVKGSNASGLYQCFL